MVEAAPGGARGLDSAGRGAIGRAARAKHAGRDEGVRGQGRWCESIPQTLRPLRRRSRRSAVVSYITCCIDEHWRPRLLKSPPSSLPVVHFLSQGFSALTTRQDGVKCPTFVTQTHYPASSLRQSIKCLLTVAPSLSLSNSPAILPQLNLS